MKLDFFQEDDAYFNRARITSILANGSTVWVGTGEGNLIIYEIQETSQIKTPTVRSPSTEYVSSVHSGDTCKVKEDLLKEVTTKDIKTRLLHVDHNVGRRKFLEHNDSMEVNFNPNSPSPADLSQNSCESDLETEDKPRKTQKYYTHKKVCQEPVTNKEVNEVSVKANDELSNVEDMNRDKNQKLSFVGRPTFENCEGFADSNKNNSEKSEKKRFGSYNRKTSECCLQVPEDSVELGEQENPLEQVYEADARRVSFEHELINPTEAEEHQKSNRRGSKHSLVKLKSENNILLNKKEARTEELQPSAEETAFEEKMEEYARRKSSSLGLLELEDFERIQAIYDQTLKAQNRGSLNLSVEGNCALKHQESFESRQNSCKSKSTVFLEKEDHERLQSMYEEAVATPTRERKKSCERRRKASLERMSFNTSIAEENKILESMETIKDDAADHETESPIMLGPRNIIQRQRRRSSSDSDLHNRAANDNSNEQMTPPHRKSTDGKQWNRERRRSSSENDLLTVHQPENSIECHGRSESLIKCDASERKEEIYEEKLEEAALIETFESCQLLSPYLDSISPSSYELTFSPASENSSLFEMSLENIESHKNSTWNGSEQETLPSCQEDQGHISVQQEYYESYSEEHIQNGDMNLARKESKHYKSNEKNKNPVGNGEKALPPPNGISDALKERLLQNYHHSEVNLDLKAALNVLNKRRASEIAKLQRQHGKGDTADEQNQSLTDSPNREQRSLSEGFNIFRGLSIPWAGRKSSLKKEGLENTGGFEDSDGKEITHEEKVGMWLSSISSDPDGNSSEKDGVYLNVKQGMNKGNDKNGEKSESSSEDDVFLSAKEKDPDSNSDSHPTEQKTAAIRPSHIVLKKKKEGHQKMDSTDSDGKMNKSHASSKDSPLIPEKNLKNKDAEAQYRLEFSGVHVETDHDSEKEKSAKMSNGTSDIKMIAKLRNTDKRKSSLDLGSIEEKCNRFYETFLNKIDRFTVADSDEIPLRISDRHKLFEYLRTPSLESRQLSIGPKIAEDELDWADVFTPQYSTQSPSSSADHRMADFLKTPSLSSKPSSLWSSYENISTPTEQDNKHLTTILHRGHLSHSASTASFSSDTGVIYNVDLILEAKMKISDKPVKCLLPTRYVFQQNR